MIVFLVPAGRERFELYSEAPDEPGDAAPDGEGRLRRWTRAAGARWRELVEAARRGRSRGRLARWRDLVVGRLAESIAEQRTLWALRHAETASLRFPATLDGGTARATLDGLLAHARRYHVRWFFADLALFGASSLLFFLPGPNVVAYYFLFRWVGHLQSWRGARRAMEGVAWTLESDAGLAELAQLVDVPRHVRAPRVAAIAARLKLPRLTAFFDRVAVPST
jgi:hypothetical protein